MNPYYWTSQLVLLNVRSRLRLLAVPCVLYLPTRSIVMENIGNNFIFKCKTRKMGFLYAPKHKHMTHTPNKHRRSKNRTPYGSHQRTPTSHREPHRGWRVHLHGENGLHPQTKPQGTPPRGAPPRPHRQATTPAATRATSQAPEEDEGTATAPRARDRNPQRTRDQGTGPLGGQPLGHLPDPPARAARPGPHSTDPASHPHLTAPPSHQPTTLRPALRTTTQARLTSTDPPRHNTGQHGTPHRSAPQCNAPRQRTPKRNTPQHDATRRGTERHNTARLTLT